MTDQVYPPSKEISFRKVYFDPLAAGLEPSPTMRPYVPAYDYAGAQAEIERLRAALAQVTAAYDKLLKRMGAVREAIGTDPHFEPGSQS